ncbi:MAG TPA: enolase C-terminal domain-like protein [Acidimicrobiia bacterium]
MTIEGCAAGIHRVDVASYDVPTDRPEADGTLQWDHTTVVVVHVEADGTRGLGFTYATGAVATLVRDVLAGVVLGRDPMDVPGAWDAMVRAIRNQGRPGITSMAIAAVDIALWDLKAKLLDVALARLLGTVRDRVPIYGSGGFTSYSDGELESQLGRWVHEMGIPRVKMKIGTDRGTRAARDLERVAVARKAVGEQAELFVDANGAYGRKQAVRLASRFADEGVTWFEEPVSSDDLDGLHEIRGLTPIDIAAGEYGYDLVYFQRMCAAGAVDVVQADVSRCAGITEWLRVAAVAQAHGLRLSGHCSPSLHLHPAAAVQNLEHVEYFHDHVRADHLLFDGVCEPDGGALPVPLDRPGLGLVLKADDADRYRSG